MSAKKEMNLMVFKNNAGVPIRFFQVKNGSYFIAQNKITKRVELLNTLESDSLKAPSEEPRTTNTSSIHKTHTLLQKITIENSDFSHRLKSNNKSYLIKGLGVLAFHTEQDQISNDTPLREMEETPFPFYVKWSGTAHGFVLGLLVLLAFLMPKSNKEIAPISTNSIVTINLKEEQKITEPTQSIKQPRSTVPVEKTVSINKNTKIPKNVKVVPRTDKRKSLLVKNNLHGKYASNSTRPPSRFLRMGTMGESLNSINNALKGSKNGMGSGLRVQGATGFGGSGRGAGIGKGNGTMGHGNDSGGGYEQALYGKGLIAGQVGNGQGGFGSGWGEGRRGSGSYGNSNLGTKGKAGGHEGYGNSKLGGSGPSVFAYPVHEETVVEGGLDRDAVDLVVMKNLGQITYCYEIGLQKKSSLRGRVLVDFSINAQGSVSSLSISSSSLHAPNVESCMLGKIKNWKFPRPVGGVTVDVNYPFALQRVSQN